MMEFVFSKNMENVAGSAIRDLMAVITDPEIISLAGGNPSPDTFPADILGQYAQEILSEKGGSILQYGKTEGYAPLVESCAQRNALRGICSDESHILPISGSSQAIDLVTKVMINRGDVILCETPTFMGALQTFHTYGAQTVGVESDDYGILPEDLEEKIKLHKPKILYVIPTFQNPSGQTWSLKRRQEVLAIAQKYNVLILEDDPYGELRYRGEALPSIASFDDEGCVVHMNSFSKTISPGLRVGYVTAQPELLRKMIISKQGVDVHTSNLSQALVDRFLRSGQYEKHVETVCDFYKKKLEQMIKGIEMYFPDDAVYTHPDGGLFVWLKLPESIDTYQLLDKAVEHKVAYVPGKTFFPDAKNAKDNFLRLNFSMASAERILEGCKRLGTLISNELK